MTEKNYVDVMLLIALPASGKSEVRRYLMHVDRERRIEQFHLSDTVQLDDYPYVEFFRDTDAALVELGQAPRFFEGANGRFLQGEDWGTLLQLVNEDYTVMTNPSLPTPVADAERLFDRIDAARTKVGAPVVFGSMSDSLRASMADKLTEKTGWVINELFSHRPTSMEGKTLVIEFARGGPQGADMPLSEPHGYGWNLAQLHPDILRQASVLYIWVEPEESRRKNAARAVPPPGVPFDPVIFHAAPETVMINDYGCDDIKYLMSVSEHPNTIPIHAHGQTYYLPIARFDNRNDYTTMLLDEPETWDADAIGKTHAALAEGLGRMWTAYKQQRG